MELLAEIGLQALTRLPGNEKDQRSELSPTQYLVPALSPGQRMRENLCGSGADRPLTRLVEDQAHQCVRTVLPKVPEKTLCVSMETVFGGHETVL